MMSYRQGWIWLLLAAGVWLPASARAAEAHVHGIGKLDVIAEGADLTLRLESPLDNLVGFERAPRNAKEQAAVRRMAAALRSEKAFVPTRAAQCRLSGVSLESPVLNDELLGNSPPPAGQAHAKDAHEAKHGHGKEHADLVADYAFQCGDPAALVGLEARLFDTFKALERLDVQVVGPRGQTGAKLTLDSRRVSW
jgi:hypothetical protein